MNVQDVLSEKIAQELLTSTEPARLAYTWKDGTPGSSPVGSTGTGPRLWWPAPRPPPS